MAVKHKIIIVLALAFIAFGSPCPVRAEPSEVFMDAFSSSTIFLLNHAMRESLAGNQDAIWRLYIDRGKIVAGGDFIWLDENLLYLYSSHLGDRDRYLFWQNEVGRVSSNRFLKERVRNNISSDEMSTAKRLLRENRYNHFASGLNHTSAAVTSLLEGQMQPFAQLPIDLAYGLVRASRATPQERKSLALLNQFHEKYPHNPEFAGMEGTIKRLERKRMEQIFEQQLTLGRLFARKRDSAFVATSAMKAYGRAMYHYQNALALRPAHKGVQKEINRLESEIVRQNRERMSSMSVLAGEDFFSSDEERKGYEAIVNTLSAGDATSLLVHSSSFLRKYPGSNYADDVKYAMALYFFFNKDRGQFLKEMSRLSTFYAGTNAALSASAVLASPEFNHTLGVRRAEEEQSVAIRRYILFGERTTDDQLYLVSSGLAQAPQSAAQNLGVFFVLDVAMRGVSCFFSEPVQSDELLDATASYIHAFPEDPITLEMRKKLVRHYEKRGQYEQALYYARSAGTYSPGYLKKLNDRLARKLYLLVSETPDSRLKIERLSRLIAEFPDAPIVKKARRDIDKLTLDAIYEFRITKAELQNYPELRYHTGLNLEPSYLDGRRENGEITEEGVVAIKDGPVLYHLSGEGVAHEISLTVDQRDLLRIHLDEIRLSNGSQKGMEGKKGERPFPLEIAGGVGSRGVEAYPAFAPIPYEQDDLDLYR